jgi:hypothetical protein
VSLTQNALARLRKQAEEDYLQPWKPGKQPTDAEILWKYISDLQRRYDLAKDAEFLYSDLRTQVAEQESLERGRQGIFG